ncbi:hypothetical protein FOQG_17516 [Fusarium oxysporum f. sp. raphani 54005]|uniref:Uncharacterized protein n=1 Tax=Fusarium oxysporum f. sp. raphani 54005 TaxID=1089458 RepID=X0BH55_FUSOX|nr:hypothetical protein FOQG_17516 [Fusarium oxysporum f. sp. raphani 54005]
MAFGTYLWLISLAFTALSGASSADNDRDLGRRALLVERQTCSTPGWIPACPGDFPCVPPGAICCSDDFTYAMPPDNCPDGTQPITTAGDGGGSTAIEPLPTTDVLNEVWYTAEITWYYWYYYYTFIDVSTVFTSIKYTSVTTVSLTATDSAQASSLFNEFSATAIFPTPTQTTTALSGSVTKSTPPVTMTATSNNTVSTSKPTAVVAAGARAAATGDWILLTLGVGLFCLVPGFVIAL